MPRFEQVRFLEKCANSLAMPEHAYSRFSNETSPFANSTNQLTQPSSLFLCPSYISAAYHSLSTTPFLFQAGAGQKDPKKGQLVVTWMIMGIYISELILRIYALHPHLFFQRWYNWFDFVVSYEKMYEKGREKNIYIQIYILRSIKKGSE